MQTDTYGHDDAVANALDGVIVRGERDLLADTAASGLAGARAALETFYYAFNSRSADLYQQIWADDPLVQLGSPLAGIVRGSAAIGALSARMFSASSVRIQTVVDNIVAYVTPELVVFTEREHGAYTSESDSAHEAASGPAEGHSICIFRYIATQGGWRLIYHQVWLDDLNPLAHLQRAARGA